MLSLVGFVFSICVATTVAAKGGAVAGLGIALVSKPIMFEVHTHKLPSYHTLSHGTLMHNVLLCNCQAN